MCKFNSRPQSGVALLIFVVMLMGVGGIVLVGYSQGILKQVEESKFKHNQRVLKEAKEALLQFAYNYPVINGNGPGRLPCADIDNDGDADTTFGDCTTLGRLPWNEPNLNLYDIRDADGQRLWYAVSDNFATNVPGGNTINSDATGTITIRDQSGNVIYDGSSDGVAAVIIAPGKVTARNGVTQDRSVANADDPLDTTADTDPGIINATNYLDRRVGTEDNADFTQGSAIDGFILGPVDIQSTNAVNDQMILITAAEVIDVAEKATLQAYRAAINDYLTQTGSVYPWLYNYTDVPDVPGLSSYYPANANFATELATNLGNIGRIPSISGDYFTETDSQPIETMLNGSISLGGPATVGGFLFFDGPTLNFNKLANVSFFDIDPNVVGRDGRLTATALTPLTIDVYFWEYDHNEPYMGGWSLCAAGANQLSDCNRDSLGNPTPGVLNDIGLDIIHMVVTLDFPNAANFDMDYTDLVPTVAAANGTAHALITGTFAGAKIISLPLTATYERDQHYHDGDLALDPADGDYETGPINMNDFNRDLLSLTMRFYPELPDWVFNNGWHDSVMMAYANDYRPDVLGGNCVANPPCIQINGLAGTNNDKISILALAGERNWIDGSITPPVAADGSLADDVGDVFNLENSNLDSIFDMRTIEDTGAPGDTQLDKILVIN